MTDDDAPSMTFERIDGDLWLCRDRDGQVRHPAPVTLAVAQAYARLLHIPGPDTDTSR